MSDTRPKVIRVGTRKSQLALVQTHHVVDELKKFFPQYQFEIVERSTTGDQILDKALSKIGEKNLFTKELEFALEANEVDFVVHSLKDLPTTLPDNMVIGAILDREDPRDAVVMKENSLFKNMSELPKGSKVGSSSVRRAAQIRAKYPGLEIVDIRGNLNTRFRKLDDEKGQYHCIILATAGIKRLKWENRISQYLENEDCLHAVGQGALAVECRQGDGEILDIIGKLHDRDTLLACIAEREFMKKLEGGCSTPVAAHAFINEKREIVLEGGVWSLDGKESLKGSKTLDLSLKIDESLHKSDELFAATIAKNLNQSELIISQMAGCDLANELLEKGAKQILTQARSQS